MSRTSTTIAVGLLAALIVAGAAAAGANVALGAHPWWALKTGVIGAGLGSVLFVAVRRLGGWGPLAVGLGLLCAAGAAAYCGKQGFVASIGENALAGNFWFFGWFGVSAGATVTLGAVFTSFWRAPR